MTLWGLFKGDFSRYNASMTLLNTPDAYGTLSKILHWLMMVLFLPMLFMGHALHEGWEFAQQVPHEIMGKIMLVLVILRLVLRLCGESPQPLPSHAKWEVGLSHLTHWGFYIVLIIFPISGWMMVSAGDWAETGALPAFLAPHATAEFWEETHEALKKIAILLILLHVAGALKHMIIDRDGTFQRMWFNRD